MSLKGRGNIYKALALFLPGKRPPLAFEKKKRGGQEREVKAPVRKRVHSSLSHFVAMFSVQLHAESYL